MRTLLQTIVLAMILSSCENEPLTTPGTTATEPAGELSARGPVDPANILNAYDIAGELHAEILEAYLPLEDSTATVAAIIARLDSITATNTRFTALTSSGYTLPTAIRINEILTDPANTYSDILVSASMGTAAKGSANDFIDDVLSLYDSDADFNDVYDFIVGYESAVLSSTAFTTSETEILLINASVARYSMWFSSRHKKRKPRDRDWDTLFTTLTAGIEGAIEGPASAAMKSAVAAAVANL